MKQMNSELSRLKRLVFEAVQEAFDKRNARIWSPEEREELLKQAGVELPKPKSMKPRSPAKIWTPEEMEEIRRKAGI
jgi:hypothetical protein